MNMIIQIFILIFLMVMYNSLISLFAQGNIEAAFSPAAYPQDQPRDRFSKDLTPRFQAPTAHIS